MSEEDRQLREALDNLRLISDTMQRTRQEVWGGKGTPMLALGIGMLVGTVGGNFIDGWLASVWWVLIGVAITGSMILLRAQQSSSMSNAVRWMMRRSVLIWVGVNVQGWALTLLSLLYNAYPSEYIMVIWMIVIGVHFITSGLFSQPVFIAMGLVYIIIATVTAMLWPSAQVFGLGFIAAGLISSIGFIGVGLQMQRNKRRTTLPPPSVSLRHSEVS